MFERRLRILLIVLSAPALAVLLRLFQLQIVQGARYQAETQKLLERPATYLPCLRGEITDRNGLRLAYDAPSWDVAVHYGVITDEAAYLKKLSRFRTPEELQSDLAASWAAISELTGISRDELDRKREQIRRRVERIREDVSRRRGVDTPVEEEETVHPVVSGLTLDAQVEARVRLAPFEWVEVVPGHSRRYDGGEPVGHLLGRLMEVGPDDIRNDPRGDEELVRYEEGDLRGLRGAELLGEAVLRGHRGKVEQNLSGAVDVPAIEPSNGGNLRLSIDYRLQRAAFERLSQAVAEAGSPGGCAVVLDIPTRQVLAMVDVPSVDPNATERVLQLLAYDQLHRPDLFRAVRMHYPPGSIVKPMVLAAALEDNKIAPGTLIRCRGHLFPDLPDKYRCTGQHGEVDPEFAIQHSCNVFFYVTGERMGVPQLAWWMDQFGLGRTSGSGLVGEARGILPFRSGSAAARFAGIGQEVALTPLQAANMIATVGAGAYRPVTLRLDDPEPRPPTDLPISPAHWRIVREGMYKAVNEYGGTAYGPEKATLEDAEYVLLGKTGTAEERGRTVEWQFTCRFPDGQVNTIVAANRDELLADYEPGLRPEIIGRQSFIRVPADEEDPTHAWFAGYLVLRRSALQPATAPGSLAIAVVIEYGGHGGAVASPVARDVLRDALRLRREDAGEGGTLP